MASMTGAGGGVAGTARGIVCGGGWTWGVGVGVAAGGRGVLTGGRAAGTDGGGVGAGRSIGVGGGVGIGTGVGGRVGVGVGKAVASGTGVGATVGMGVWLRAEVVGSAAGGVSTGAETTDVGGGEGVAVPCECAAPDPRYCHAAKAPRAVTTIMAPKRGQVRRDGCRLPSRGVPRVRGVRVARVVLGRSEPFCWAAAI